MRLRAFLRLSRPLFLYGGFAGVALGAAVARGAGAPIAPGPYLWVQALVTALQLMVHYANDYFDREGDLHGTPARWSGGSGVLATGALAPHVALIAAGVCAAIGLAVATQFALAGNRVVAAVGLAIVAASWAYSAPPLRLAARGLGELDAALVVGALVPAAGYAAFIGTADARIALAVAPGTLAMIAMMLGVELPDAAADAASGKRTLVVRLGRRRASTLLAAAALAALAAAAPVAWRAGGAAGAAAVAPGALAAGAAAFGAVHPAASAAAVAFLGVALDALIVTGLAIAYAVGPPG